MSISSIISSVFKLNQYNTNIKTEFIAGLTTFMSSSYILFVNPIILSKTGMNIEAVFLSTAILMSISSLFMGLYANLPIAIAPAMGGNTWFTFTIVLGLGYSWQQGLFAVFLASILFLLFALTNLRKYLINAFSRDLQLAIAIGIGAFVMSLGMKMSGIVVESKDVIVTLGDLLSIPCLCTFFGLILIVILDRKRITGSLFISILVLSIISLFLHQSHYTGIFKLPNFSNNNFFAMDIKSVVNLSFLSVVLSIFLLSFLDGTGSFISIIERMGSSLKDKRVTKGLATDGLAITMAGIVGSSPGSTLVESVTGISAGGRTGLVAVFFGLFSICMIFFSSVLTLVPSWSTAPALIYVGFLMFTSIGEINWKDSTEAFPAFVTILIMPLTSSIANGIGVGIFLWLVIAILTKKLEIRKHWILFLVLLGYVLIITNHK